MGDKFKKLQSLVLLQKASKQKFTKEKENLFKLGTRMIHIEFLTGLGLALVAHIYLKIPLYIIKELSFILLCLLIITGLYINRGYRSLTKMEKALAKAIEKELELSKKIDRQEPVDKFFQKG